MSEEYINKENVFHAYGSYDEFSDSENLDFKREYCYELFDIDHIAFVAVIELKSVRKHFSVQTRKNQLTELLSKSVDWFLYDASSY